MPRPALRLALLTTHDLVAWVCTFVGPESEVACSLPEVAGSGLSLTHLERFVTITIKPARFSRMRRCHIR